MNGTHRGLNRAVLMLLGLVLLGLGAVAVMAGASKSFASGLTTSGTLLWEDLQASLAATPIPGAGISWWTAAVFVLLILTAILLVCWIASQGTGRSNQLMQHDGSAGKTLVDTAVAGDAIKAALGSNTQVLSTNVQSWKTKGAAGGNGLKINIQARKGASPAELTAAVEHLLQGLDGLLGAELPVLVRIKSGTRTRFSRTGRVD